MVASSAQTRGLLSPQAPPTLHKIEDLEFSLEGSQFRQCRANFDLTAFNHYVAVLDVYSI